MPEVLQVDASIPLKAQPPTFDPMATVGRLQTVQQGILQNRLLGQQVKGKEVLGSIIGGATGPDGKTDWDVVNARAAQTPEAAILLPDIQKASLERQIADLQRKREELGLTEGQGKFLSAGMLPFVQKFTTPDPQTGEPPIPTKEDFREALVNVIGAMGPAVDSNVTRRAVALLQGATDNGPKLIETAKGIALLGNPSADMVTMLTGGAPTTLNTGPETLFVRTPTLGGAPSVVGKVPMGLAPGEQNSPAYTYRDPKTGQDRIVTKAEAAATPLGQQPGGIVSGLPVGAEGARNLAATKAAEQAAALGVAAEQVPARKALLGNLEGLVGQFGSGPSADWKKIAAGLVNANNPWGPLFDVKKIASQEEFNKQAAMLAQEQFKALGGTGTDAKLDSAMSTSPNSALSRMGNVGIIRMLKGNEDALAAKNGAWQAWLASGKGPESYGQFTTQFNQIYDPRVFQSVYMDDKGRAEMLKGMTEAEQKKFRGAYANAVKFGWIPGGQ